jgi:hypothetical protein
VKRNNWSAVKVMCDIPRGMQYPTEPDKAVRVKTFVGAICNDCRKSKFPLAEPAANPGRCTPGESLLKKEVLRRKQFGRSFGGPVIKDKNFFFASYSGLRQRRPVFNNSAAPPTVAERNGIFGGRIRDAQ